MTLIWMVPVTGAAAVLFALWLAYDVLRRDTGTPAMQEIAGMIFEGAMAFLSRQYRTIAILAIVTSVAVALIVGSISNGVHPYFLGTFYVKRRDQKSLAKGSELFRRLQQELYNTQVLATYSQYKAAP